MDVLHCPIPGGEERANLTWQYLVEFQHIQIRVPDEADITAAVAHCYRAFANPDVFMCQPSYQLVHAVDNEGGVGIAWPLNRRVKKYVAFIGGLAVVDQVFPPKSVYGLKVVQEAVGDGWEYSYMIHNHTIQNHLNDPVPGVPAPSTTDISFARNLASDYGLKAIRVTNGVYTFSSSIAELGELDAR
ncbi:MAG: hypothetical protein QHC66_13895 [Pusillimonas sp.]|nr:hypothetical protein [Pusillimonas sp.]